MNSELSKPPGFWTTVRLLLGAARRKSVGRRRRQQELLHQRAGKSATNWGGIGFALASLFMIVLNVLCAFVLTMSVESGERLEAERRGKIVVSGWFLNDAREAEAVAKDPSRATFGFVGLRYSDQAKRIADRYGGDPATIEQTLRASVREHGTGDLINSDDAAPGIKVLPGAGQIPAMLGSVTLLIWAVMLVFQGEGLELDLQRRRHPMWEWLFSHPVPPGAIFFAEMLSPIAANPIYWGAPLFAGFLYGSVYDPGAGIQAIFLIGVPITIAAACLGKALEIGVVLRFSPRTRGAVIGIMGWLGYASMMSFIVAGLLIPKIGVMGKLIDLLAVLPWPWLRLFLGGQLDGSFSFLSGVLACWFVSILTVAGSVWFSVWGTQRGLTGNFAAVDLGPSSSRTGRTRFGKEPLYRKEFLWFIRDRSAIVQTILIPLTVAGLQLFNLRALLAHAQGTWNYLCGAAILFGTYFLWVLGPKSLASEGTALWIPLTWPRGMESLLKAKAWLWSMIASGIVALVLCYAAFLFPAHLWKIALVGIGWVIFGRSMAEKSVTLVSVTSSSGEPEKIPWTRRMATQLGMVTFAVGVLTQQWNLAVVGIVYSYLTAAAMWQNFRARLPFLYDPWSEQLPPPPTLMHAMIAISILVEGGAVFTGTFLVFSGRDNIAIAQAFSYGICAVMVSLGVSSFLDNRDVKNRDVWRWPASQHEESRQWWRGDATGAASLLRLLLLGSVAGLALGLFAHAYVAVLNHIPTIAETLRKSQEQMAKIPNLKLSYGVMAVVFAPFAEEYLFRGLLFRALDREWGGWRAVFGSAAFFAIYHPALSWLPVGLLGVANAFIFKKTGRLAPAVALHMVYNLVVVTTS